MLNLSTIILGQIKQQHTDTEKKMNKNEKWICENCGSSDIQYRMEVWLDVNDVENGKVDRNTLPDILEYSDTDTSTWCNNCETHSEVNPRGEKDD